MKTLFLDEAFRRIGVDLFASVDTYFASVRTKFLYLFAGFVCFVLLVTGIMKKWGTRYLKKMFQTTNAIVGLIPSKWLAVLRESTPK